MKRMKRLWIGGLAVLLWVGMACADQVDTLLEDLASGDKNKQVVAAVLLKKFRDPRVAQAAIVRAGDAGTPLAVRKPCIQLIRDQRIEAGLETLLKIAQNVEEPFAVRGPAIYGLVDLSGSKHVELLLKFIREDKSENVKRSAATALGATKDAKVAPKALELLDDPKTARYGLIAISIMGEKSAVPKLVKLLKTDDQNLRYTVIDALGELADKRAVAPMLELYDGDENPHQRGLILRAFGKIDDPQVVSKLSALAGDKKNSQNVRTVALLSIGELKAKGALSVVSAVASGPTEQVILRQVATRQLGKLGDEAIPTLISLLDDKAVASDAALSLRQVTGVYFGVDRARWTAFYKEYKKRKERQPQ